MSLNYHIVFSTKARRPVLMDGFQVDVSREASLAQTARDIKSLSSGGSTELEMTTKISRGSPIAVHYLLGIHKLRLSSVTCMIRCLTT